MAQNALIRTDQPHAQSLPERYGNPAHPTDPDGGWAICAAKAKRPNRYGDHVCLGRAMPNTGRCRVHGGATPRGIAAPAYQGKGYSKDMPTRLLDRYKAALDDPNMLSMSHEIAVVDARIGELLSQLDTGESGSIWKGLRASVDGLEQARLEGSAARRAKDEVAAGKAEDALAQHLNDIVVAVKRGSAEYTRWRELYDAFERRRRLVETMRKQRRDVMNFISSEQLILVLDKIGDLVQQNVSDKAALAAIATGIARIVRTESANGDHDGT